VGFHEKRVRKDLPPPETWLHQPSSDLLPTPVDSRGLVDFDGLVKLMKSTVDPSYDWRASFNDKHHLQWPNRYYRNINSDSLPNPAEFRNLGIGIVKVPRLFHNWVHLITEPPAVPDNEVMMYRIEAQRVALSLFESVKIVKQEGRVRLLSGQALRDYMLDELEQRFDEFAENLDEARSQPVEFYPVDYSKLELNEPRDMVVIADRIARQAIYRIAVRSIREPLVA